MAIASCSAIVSIVTSSQASNRCCSCVHAPTAATHSPSTLTGVTMADRYGSSDCQLYAWSPSARPLRKGSPVRSVRPQMPASSGRRSPACDGSRRDSSATYTCSPAARSAIAMVTLS